MPALHCPRCQRVNPDVAAFCYFDGYALRAQGDGAGSGLARLSQDIVFPSGRRCGTFDDLAQGCHEEWVPARDMLKQGFFRQFFQATGRADLAKAAGEAMAQADADIALTMFLGALPVSHAGMPRLDLNPRRLLLGNLLAGETRQLQLIISNQGQGQLQGTVKVVEGAEWLKLARASDGQLPIKTPKLQQVSLEVDTRGLPAGQTYGAKLTVVTNGGVVEVPARLDLVAHPFTKPPFQGVKKPREIAERMRAHPKQAGPMLESGEVARWFAANGWNFPVRAPLVKGVAGVQQFFEAMGLSKPPVVQVSQPEVRLTCQYPEKARFQVALHTQARKWVYGQVESEVPWLKVVTPNVAGPQQANFTVEVDPRHMSGKTRADGKLKIIANGGQRLSVRVACEVRGVPMDERKRGFLQPIVTMALAFFLLRFFLVFVVDAGARSAAVANAATNLNHPPQPDTPLRAPGGWLQLPWHRILTSARGAFPAELLAPAAQGEISLREFRDYYASSFLRRVIGWTWWIGPLLGGIVLWRRGGLTEVLWGLIAGAAFGVAVAATVACGFLVLEILPHLVWAIFFGSHWGALWWLFWVVTALATWTVLGGVLGYLLSLVGPLRRVLLQPVQQALAGLCRLCGLQSLARYCHG